jgi:hypothetical protein
MKLNHLMKFIGSRMLALSSNESVPCYWTFNLASFFSRLLKCKEVYGFAFTTVLFISAAVQAYDHLRWQLLLKQKALYS